MSEVKKLVTHNGSFHADDLFACAILSILLKKKNQKFEIIRTRDEEIVKNGDYVFDVGGIYDAEMNRFDHHQKEGAGHRENGIPYSSFGLIWKHFGMEICDGDGGAWKIIDTKIASSVDARDNGFNIYTPKYEDVTPYSGAQPFLIFSPTWKESDTKTDEIFREQVKNAVKVLEREIEVAKADSEGRRIIEEQYQKSEDKRIIELPHSFPRYLYQETLSKFEEPIYVIYASTHTQAWKVEAIQKSRSTMESRKLFPESWRGFLTNDKGLVEITGVPDVVFCHRNGFLLGVNSREGAYKLAELALKS
jgi:uncharacterized UPF0160 family protein